MKSQSPGPWLVSAQPLGPSTLPVQALGPNEGVCSAPLKRGLIKYVPQCVSTTLSLCFIMQPEK